MRAFIAAIPDLNVDDAVLDRSFIEYARSILGPAR
jgi:hypothetical protein